MTIQSHRQQFAINASLYGKRGGTGCSTAKKSALAQSITKAHLANRIKQAERGTLFQVVGTDFMGNDRACRHYIKSNSLKGAEIVPVLVSQLS